MARRPWWLAAMLVVAVAVAGCDSGDAGSVDGDGGGDSVTAGDSGVVTDGGAATDGGVDTPVDEVIDTPVDEVIDTPIDEPTICPTATLDGALGVTGRVYADTDANDLSVYALGLQDGVDEPTAELVVSLLGADGAEVATTTTCADGTYAFADLEPGVYVAEPALSPGAECTSRNCARRFPKAVREGHVSIVTIGDSVPVTGDAPFFPTKLATLLDGVAVIDSENIAVGGTTSHHWLPSTSLFENALTPRLAEADVLIISLGGNDLMAYVSGFFQNPELLEDLDAAIAGAKDEVLAIMERILVIVAAVQSINPDLDIVYCLYPNYGQAVDTSPWGLVDTFLGTEVMLDILDLARDIVPYGPGMQLADLYGAFEDLPLDDYLFDPLHFNAEGHTVYAETLFQVLGGVLIGPSPLSPNGSADIGLAHTWSWVPE